MSLFGSIHLANNTLQAMQIGLQVAGQNIANANTPGYIREEVVLTPAQTQRRGNLLLGLGVQVTGVIQKIDKFLEERLRGASSDRVNSETQEGVYLQLESLIGELGETDLSTSLSNFFNSISEVLNQPESVSVRNLAILQGQTLTADVTRMAQRVVENRTDINTRILNVGGEINSLTEEIRTLNIRIAAVEGGGSSNSDAVGLRDQRGVALAKLAELVDTRVIEQPSGGVAVYVGGDYLVLEGERREVSVAQITEDGTTRAEIQVTDTKSKLETRSGELAGLLASRDTILGGFLQELDDFAAALSFEFNKIFSGGQGLTGFQSLTSEFGVESTSAALDSAGLPYKPTNGSFDIQVLNKQTGLTKTTTIQVPLGSGDGDLSLDDLAAALNDVEGISASISADRKLTIKSTSAATEFAFAGDSSSMSALGLNTFFSGRSALDMRVNDVLANDPAKFAASRGGIGQDSQTAVDLAALLERPLDAYGGSTLLNLYDGLVGGVAQASTVTHSVAEGYRVFEDTLRGQQMATSGVSLDEEAVRMITYQRTFQASARYIATIADLLDIMVNL